MEYSAQIQLILNGLNRDRAEIVAKLTEIDTVIKKVKSGLLDFGDNKNENTNLEEHIKQSVYVFPAKSSLKIQLLSILDKLGHAAKMKEIQSEYTNLTGSNITVRDTLRTLNKHNLLKIMRDKNDFRGTYWVKADWLEDNNTKLKDEYKFEGFDQLYKAENLEFV